MAKQYTKNKKLSISNIANNSSWQKMLGLGTTLFVIFFWVLPAVLTAILRPLNNISNATQNANTQQLASGMNSLIEYMSSLVIVGIKGVGCVFALICILFAIRNYFPLRNERY